jgi:hypothetical protein
MPSTYPPMMRNARFESYAPSFSRRRLYTPPTPPTPRRRDPGSPAKDDSPPRERRVVLPRFRARRSFLLQSLPRASRVAKDGLRLPHPAPAPEHLRLPLPRVVQRDRDRPRAVVHVHPARLPRAEVLDEGDDATAIVVIPLPEPMAKRARPQILRR